MRIPSREQLDIQDLGRHNASTLIEVALLLAGGAHAAPDPRHKHCYEISHGATVYYIYVSPVDNTISLLATWRNFGPPRLDNCFHQPAIHQPGPSLNYSARRSP